MSQHKDLPPGSQAWAKDVDALLKEVEHLREVVRRLTENAGIDYSNPKRGLNAGGVPSTNNPVGQKLSSLADTDTYNVADGQYLSWSQRGQKWLPVTPPAGGGVQWRPATEDEKLWGDLIQDSDYETAQVIGIVDPSTAGATQDSYGLVGTANATSYLHAAGRYFGGPTRSHGYVTANPYYVHIGTLWTNDDDTVAWQPYGEIMIGRGDIYLKTPRFAYHETDGLIKMETNWFIVPKFTTANRPVPRDVPGGLKGAMIFDETLGIPVFFDGVSGWTNALGTAV